MYFEDDKFFMRILLLFSLSFKRSYIFCFLNISLIYYLRVCCLLPCNYLIFNLFSKLVKWFVNGMFTVYVCVFNLES